MTNVNNRGMFSQLSIIIDSPFVVVNGHKFNFTYDPPHLLKCVSKNFRCYPVNDSGGMARCDHVKKFFELDGQKKLILASERELVHIILNGFKEMNVRLAAQVLNHSVSHGIT